MVITHDKGLVNEKLITMGFGVLDVHSIRLDRYYTEEEKQHNYQTSQTMSTEEWSQHCRNISNGLVAKITTIMDAVNDRFTVQGKESGRDMSYVTLTLNEKDTIENRTQIVNRLVDFLEQYEEKGVQTIIQYKTLKNEGVIKEAAERVYEDIEDRFVELNGYGTGKVRLLGDGYAFFKKGARKNYYHLEPLALCTIIKFKQKQEVTA